MSLKFTLTRTALSILSILLTPALSFSQDVPCPPNLDFEFGNLTNWQCSVGGAGGANGGNIGGNIVTPVVLTGPAAGRQEIMAAGSGSDFYGKFPVVDNKGGAFALKLGNDITGDSAERVRYTFDVPAGSQKYAIKFKYAVVFEDPGHVPSTDQPRFIIQIYDSTAAIPLDCAEKTYVAANDIPGFFTSNEGLDVRYLPWAEGVINLKGTAGHRITIDVGTSDCSLGGHFGYGYFDVIECGEYKVALDSCNLDNLGAVLTGPEGYKTYEWWNKDYTQLMDTGRFAAFHPLDTIPEVYNLVLTPYPSVSLCKDTLTTVPLANIRMRALPDTSCLAPNTMIQLDANARGGSGPFTYEWNEFGTSGNTLSCTNCPKPNITAAVTSFYTVKATDTNSCYRTDTVSIGVNTDNRLEAIEDFVLCHPGYTTLDVTPVGPLPHAPVTCGLTTATCTSTTTTEIRSLFRSLGPREDTSSSITPFAAQYSSGHMQFILKKEDMLSYGVRYGTLTSLGFNVVDPGTTDFSNFTISLGCTNQTQLTAINPNTSVVYTAPSHVMPTAGWNDFNFDQGYNWDTAQNLLIDICFTNAMIGTPATVKTIDTRNAEMYMEYTNNTGLNLCGGDKPEGIAINTARPIMRMNFCNSADTPFAYSWTPGLYLSDSTIKTPLAYIPKTTEYFVRSMGGNGCPIIDSVTVTIPIHDYEIAPKDTVVCADEPFQLHALGTFSSVRWFEYDKKNNVFTTPATLDCATCTDPVASPRDTMSYALEYTDKDGCNDTLYMTVLVKPLPNVHILNNDTTIKYGQDLLLLATGAYLYTWSPDGALNNPNLVNPIASPKEPTLYSVIGLAENGCRSSDSVMVNIDYRANLFVPTAFTPNGDGKNDIFRVSNITFQRLQEFRVFNRWGQEIFSTNDIRSGWDGSWKGQPQDAGVYQYIIKVAYPDGVIETYKGDVTLVR